MVFEGYSRPDEWVISRRVEFKNMSPQNYRKYSRINDENRYKIDLTKLYGNDTVTKSRNKRDGFRLIKGPIAVVLAVSVFFIMGYLIAALSVPLWAKIFIFAFVSLLGFTLSYIVANLLY